MKHSGVLGGNGEQLSRCRRSFSCPIYILAGAEKPLACGVSVEGGQPRCMAGHVQKSVPSMTKMKFCEIIQKCPCIKEEQNDLFSHSGQVAYLFVQYFQNPGFSNVRKMTFWRISNLTNIVEKRIILSNTD